MSYRFDLLRPSDIDECARLFASNIPTYFLPHEKADFIQFLTASPEFYGVVRDDQGQVVACGGLGSRQPGEKVLCWGIVDAKLHRHGIGAYLLGVRMLAAADLRDVGSVVSNTTQLTEGFFQRYGFVTESVVKDHYAPGMDAVAMRYVLDDAGRERVKKHFSREMGSLGSR